MYQIFKNSLAETTATACRVPIFQPTRRPTCDEKWHVETSWGWGHVEGRLGQQHRNYLDAAMLMAEKTVETKDHRIHLLLDRAKLRSALGGDSVNYQLIDEWQKDLQRALVTVYIKHIDVTVTGALIGDVVNSPGEVFTRPGAMTSSLQKDVHDENRGSRRKLKITLGIAWSRLIKEDTLVRYPLKSVVAMKTGLSQAVARFCLSHITVNQSVESLTTMLGSKNRLQRRVDMLNVDREALRELGILVADGRINYQRKSQK